MTKPLVSVLMPAYNVEKFIAESIDSQINQTYANWELLVCDDSSTDSTFEIISQFAKKEKKIVVQKNTVNKGYLKTWNYLIRQVRGDFITFLDADDFASPERIAILVDFLLENPEVDLVGSAINMVSESGSFLGVKSYPEKASEIKEALLSEKFPFCGSAVMIRRKVIEQSGIYNTFFDRIGWEDHDWLIRVCRNHTPANVSLALYSYRNNQQSVSRSFSVSQVEKLVIRKVGMEVHRIYENAGIDLFSTENFWRLHHLVNQYTQPFLRKKNLFYRFLMLREPSWNSRVFFLVKALKTNPFDLKSIYFFLFR